MYGQYAVVTNLILNKSKWHAARVPPDFHVAIAELTKGLVHMMLELVVALC